jgi:hypothetical protein
MELTSELPPGSRRRRKQEERNAMLLSFRTPPLSSNVVHETSPPVNMTHQDIVNFTNTAEISWAVLN